MSNYTKTVDFAAKDTLPSGDSGKIIKGTEFETEFDNISTAIATKADSAAPTFTGTSVFTNLDINGTVQADGAVTVGVDDTGYDVKFFGATTGKSLLWDESADSLIVTGTTTLVGTTNLDAVDVDGDMTFGDNNKAIFGAGSDLQIYSDGTTGQVTGDVNVTGSVTADGLTVDTDTLVVDATNNRVGIGTSSPIAPLHVKGTTNGNLLVRAGSLAVNTLTGTALSSINDAASATVPLTFEGSEFNFVQSNAVKVKVDASGNLLLSGTAFLGSSTGQAISFGSPTGNYISWEHGGSVVGDMGTANQAVASGSATDLGITARTGAIVFASGGTAEQMRIDASGNVGIGASSPATGLHLSGANNVSSSLTLTNTAPDPDNTWTFVPQYNSLDLAVLNNGAERMRIVSSGQTQVVGYDAMTLGFPAVAGGASRSGIKPTVTGAGAGQLQFLVGGDNTTEATTIAAMLDASGNLLVGKSALGTTAGFEVRSAGNIVARRASGEVAIFDRKTNDGEIVRLAKDGTTVGSIGVAAGAKMSVIGTNENLQIGANGVNVFNVSTTSVYPATDNATDLGFNSSTGWKDLYLSGVSYNGDGSAAAPSISFGADTNTGFYRVGSDKIGFVTAGTLRAMLDNSGNLLVGTAVAGDQGVTIYGGGANGLYSKTTATSAYWITNDGLTSATGTLFAFYNNTTPTGSITITSTNVTNYNSVSDERLKENIADADDSGSKIDAIQVRKFDWKTGGEHQDYGFIAQELVGVAPDAVTTPEDPEEMMSVDPAKLVPMMLKEIQSLRARVAQLES